MPLYELKCTNEECERSEEVVQELLSVAEYEATKDAIPCKICQKPMKRMFTGKNVLKFTGSGFYATDYNKS